jgi:hypothetical protein
MFPRLPLRDVELICDEDKLRRVQAFLGAVLAEQVFGVCAKGCRSNFSQTRGHRQPRILS